MDTCANCNGEGLIGQGDKPWLKQGRLDKCDPCNGTGKVGENLADDAPAAAESQAFDPAFDAPVDNVPNEEAPKPGFFARLFGA